MRILTLLLLPVFCLAYDFTPMKAGFEIGYQRQKIDFSYSNDSITGSKSFKNNLKKIDVLPVGGTFQIFKDEKLYIETELQFGWCWAHDVDSEIATRVSSADQSVSILLEAPFSHKADGKPLSTYIALGYPVRFGPLSIIPVYGYSYDHLEFKRKQINPVNLAGPNFTASLVPKRGIETKWYTQMTGFRLLLRPIPQGLVRLIGSYDFHWGRLSTRSSYALDSTITQAGPLVTVNNLKTNLKSNRKAWAHILHFKGIFGITQEWLLTIDFGYRYWKAREGGSKQRTKGLQTFGSPVVQQSVDFSTTGSFNGMTWQTYSIMAEAGYSF